MTETVDFGALTRRGLGFVLVEGGTRHPIRGRLRLGSHEDNDVTLEVSGVSRYHLELCAEEGGVRVKDLGSKNGTFFDGARVSEVLVGAGATIRAGGPAGVELRIEVENEPTIAPSDATRFGPVVGSSAAMRSVFTVLERTAPSNATILIHGETGTGKEMVAQAIHEASPRKDKPLVVVDCGAIPHHLIESELFGHKRGAFTDAREDRVGAFEAANGGTLFLDEIGELPIDAQPKLLRVVETRSIQRVGETERRPIDVRLVAATHRELKDEVEAGRFRRDLYFRLAVVSVMLPALRERGRDVLLLAEHILAELGQSDAIALDGPTSEALLSYAWPGNVRELRNALERAIHLGAEHAIPMAASGEYASSALTAAPEEADDLPFKEAKERLVVAFEKSYVERLMERHAGNVSAAARDAGIDRNYLYRLLKKHDLG